MSTVTSISWCHHSFNPWWGCTKVSPGCEHCYAATLAHRYGTEWGLKAKRRKLSKNHWNEPLRWNKKAGKSGIRRRVFCASMADVFEDNPQVTIERKKLWQVIEATPHLDWQLLTKRPLNVNKMVPNEWLTGHWPAHVWIGTSVENQSVAETRIPELLKVPASVRFLSCEPLIGSLDLARYLRRGINWCICGGESGPGARPMHEEWARSLMKQCAKAGTAFFMKQMGGAKDKKQGLGDLPQDLRVRQFPQIQLPR